MNDCNCKDWQEGMEQIINHTQLAVLHHARPYTAAHFRFCPWCATNLNLPEPPPIMGPRFIEWNYDTMRATQYERMGTCNRCNGEVACCKTVIDMKLHEGDKKDHGGFTTDGKGVWSEIVDQSEEREFIRFEVTDSRKQEPCEGLTPDNLCIYHGGDKQWCCRIFPTSPRDIETFPDCSYRFREISSWKFEDDED